MEAPLVAMGLKLHSLCGGVRSNMHVNLTAEQQRCSVPVMLRMPAAGYVRRWASQLSLLRQDGSSLNTLMTTSRADLKPSPQFISHCER